MSNSDKKSASVTQEIILWLEENARYWGSFAAHIFKTGEAIALVGETAESAAWFSPKVTNPILLPFLILQSLAYLIRLIYGLYGMIFLREANTPIVTAENAYNALDLILNLAASVAVIVTLMAFPPILLPVYLAWSAKDLAMEVFSFAKNIAGIIRDFWHIRNLNKQLHNNPQNAQNLNSKIVEAQARQKERRQLIKQNVLNIVLITISAAAVILSFSAIQLIAVPALAVGLALVLGYGAKMLYDAYQEHKEKYKEKSKSSPENIKKDSPRPEPQYQPQPKNIFLRTLFAIEDFLSTPVDGTLLKNVAPKPIHFTRAVNFLTPSWIKRIANLALKKEVTPEKNKGKAHAEPRASANKLSNIIVIHHVEPKADITLDDGNASAIEKEGITYAANSVLSCNSPRARQK